MASMSTPGRELTSARGEGGSREHSLSHIMPLKVLVAVWIALVLLTGITVGVTRLNLGGMALWVAMAIATLKASLVALYFMHLRYDRPVHLIIFLGTLLFVFLFVGMALIDTQSYQPDLIPGYAPAMPR
jgi:cytochrome c oxidase subunit IV